MRQATDTNISGKKADLALSLHTTGYGGLDDKKEIGYFELPGGDAFDLTKPNEEQPEAKIDKFNVNDMLKGGQDEDEITEPDSQLKTMYETYSRAAGDEDIPFTIAELCLEDPKNVSDKGNIQNWLC